MKNAYSLLIFCTFITFSLGAGARNIEQTAGVGISSERNTHTNRETSGNYSGQQKNRTVTGKIVDVNNEPIVGANIVEKGTTNGIISDSEGSYSLNVASENATLRELLP